VSRVLTIIFGNIEVLCDFMRRDDGTQNAAANALLKIHSPCPHDKLLPLADNFCLMSIV
jgi:hypothetical protein